MKYRLSLRSFLWNNFTIKVCSLVLGFFLWSLLSENQLQYITLHVPICYNGNHEEIDYSTDSCNITLQATRSAFRLLNLENLAIHINAQDLVPGKNSIIISEKHLLLPPSIKMINCYPLIAEITRKV